MGVTLGNMHHTRLWWTEIHDVVAHGVTGLSARQSDPDVEDPERATSRMDMLRHVCTGL